VVGTLPRSPFGLPHHYFALTSSKGPVVSPAQSPSRHVDRLPSCLRLRQFRFYNATLRRRFMAIFPRSHLLVGVDWCRSAPVMKLYCEVSHPLKLQDEARKQSDADWGNS